MRSIFLLITLLACTPLMAQNPASLELRGTGEMAVQPDLGVLNVEISAIKKDMNSAIAELNGKAEKLYKQLSKIGYKQPSIKTQGYNVHPHIVYRQGEAHDSGFIARQSFTVEFINSKENIGTILTSFSQNPSETTFSFSFKLSEEKMHAVRTELIQKAVKDATQKAGVITEASGKKLGDIIEIKYGQVEQVQAYNQMTRYDESSESSQMQGFEVREIRFSDSIWIKWEIK
ncbi:MAG: SIMPL domain-containing protein [Cytophagaceae bacterium]